MEFLSQYDPEDDAAASLGMDGMVPMLAQRLTAGDKEH